MLTYTILEQLPDVADYNRLRDVVGWGAYPEEVAEPCLARSLYGACALLDDAVVGMARVIGDGGMTFYIQDVIVHPDHQGRGVGAQLMDHVMGLPPRPAVPGAVVGLMAAAGKEGFCGMKYIPRAVRVHPPPHGALGGGDDAVLEGGVSRRRCPIIAR